MDRLAESRLFRHSSLPGLARLGLVRANEHSRAVDFGNDCAVGGIREQQGFAGISLIFAQEMVTTRSA